MSLRVFVLILYCMYPHCTVRIRLLYAFNKYFYFDFDFVLSRINYWCALMSVAETDTIRLIVLEIIVALMLTVIIIMAIVIHRLRRKRRNRASAASGSLYIVYLNCNSVNNTPITYLFSLTLFVCYGIRITSKISLAH